MRRPPRFAVRLFLVVFLGAALAHPVTPGTGAQQPIALGAYIAGAPWDPAKIDQFASLVGAPPAIVMWYQDWAHAGAREFAPLKLDAVVARGATPLITWEPWDYTGGTAQPAFALRAIVGGAHDAYIRQWARDAAAWGQPFYLRFAQEMNADWYPWSPGVNGNTSAEYVASWRHVVDIFRQEGTTNVRWVWSPNVAYPGSTPFAQVYPGDAYVDWVGLDGYNWGTSQSWSRWAALATVFGASYDALTALTSKPLLIAETASAKAGGDKAKWITQGLLTDLPARFPRVRAVVWFHENKETDWRVNSSSRALAAYRKAAASPTYQGRLP